MVLFIVLQTYREIRWWWSFARICISAFVIAFDCACICWMIKLRMIEQIFIKAISQIW